MQHISILRALSLPILLATLPVSAQINSIPGLRDSPVFNKTWRQTVHNAFWFGQPGREAGASGPIQHLLDGAYIDRARGWEFDLHSNHAERKFFVYHTDFEDYSLCQLFESCLDVFRAFHFGNPAHDPFMLHLEFKETSELTRMWGSSAGDLKPQDLDNLLRGKLQGYGKTLLFTPKDYLDWCETTKWNPGAQNFTEYFGEDLQKAVRFCGWPSIDHLRGRVIVTVHGNWQKNEYAVYQYSHAFGRKIRDVVAFPMAGVIGKGVGAECSDEGRPDEARRGNVCNWDQHSVFVDLLTLAQDNFPQTSPFYPVPWGTARDLKLGNFLFRSGDKNFVNSVVDARASLEFLVDTGYNMITGDAPRQNIFNQSRFWNSPPPYATGCLFSIATNKEVDGCKQTDLVEPASSIGLTATSPSIHPGMGEERQYDTIAGIFRPIPSGGDSGDFRAFISTRTDREQQYGTTNTGRIGCIMARTDMFADSPYIAVCRVRHRLAWDTSNDGVTVYYRKTRFGKSYALPIREYDDFDALHPSAHPDGSGSGIPELDPYVALGHSGNRKVWYPSKRVTDDPDINHAVSLLDNGYPFEFDEPLNYVGLTIDGGALTENALSGEFLFANVRYNGQYLLVRDFQWSPKKALEWGLYDSSSLDGLCAANLKDFVQVTGSGFTRAGFGSTRYTQQVNIRNTSGRFLPAPLTLSFDQLSSQYVTIPTANAVRLGCRISNAGPNGLTIPLPSGGLQPGQSVTMTVTFNNPTGQQISYFPSVFGMGKL